MPSTDALECRPGPALAPVLESYPAREADLGGGLVVRRLLPRSGRRLVGPWCFFDHFGPLPDARRRIAPSFAHVPELPVVAVGACRAVVLVGELNGVRSPATTYSRMVGAEVAADHDDDIALPIDPHFEHAVLLVEGHVALGDRMLEPATLHYLGSGREQLALAVRAGARLVLLGGEPFGERIVMWWNFVARTPEEIVEARDDWEQGRRFGAVQAYVGERIPAPPLTARLQRPG